MKQTHIRILFQSICLLMLSGALAAHAQNIFKAATTTMSASTDWSATDGGTPGVAPSASTVGEFGTTPTAGNLSGMTLGASMSLLGLQLDATMAGPLTISAANTLTLGTSGINMSAANQNATLGCALTLGGAQNWNVVSPQILTVNGAVAISSLLTINGTGAVTFGTTANTGAGGLTISSGTVTFGAAASAGTGTLTLGGGTLNIGAVTVANAVSVTGSATVVNTSSAGNLTFSSTFSGSGTMNLSEGSGSTVTFSSSGAFSSFTGTVNSLSEKA
jgi:hypothetical protein